MKSPWHPCPALPPEVFARIRQRAIFDCCKWDPQVEDVATLAPFPLVLCQTEWDQVVCWAQRLAAEAMMAEKELVAKPFLHKYLGLEWGVRRALRRAATKGPARSGPRLLRFDFHWTMEGWRISEVNSDVPGGLNEASGFSKLMASCFPGRAPLGDPVRSLVEAIQAAAGRQATVALAHATAFTDDRQVMAFLARQLHESGARTVLISPEHLRWHDGRAVVASDWYKGSVDLVFRFFPAEWLPNLPRACGWKHFYADARTPICNPATALLVQSKRFPLVWSRLETVLPTWEQLLPETRDPRAVDWRTDPDWVVKPACGRVGEMIGLTGATPEKDWVAIRKSVRRWPQYWVAQRRFTPVPMPVEAGSVYPCVGVFTLDARVIGVYGRVASIPLIDHRAREAAVLVEVGDQPGNQSLWESTHESIGAF